MSDPGVQASIHKNLKTTLPRINNYISSNRFREVNLVGRLYPDSRPITLSHWALPGGEGAWQSWSFDDVIKQEFTPVSIGDSFGPTWTTHWFKLEFEVPEEWKGKEVRIRWGTNSEATVWSHDGHVLQGLSTGDPVAKRSYYTITRSYEGQAGPQVFYIEMAANKLLGAYSGDQIDPPDPDMMFTLTLAEIALLDSNVYQLTHDLEVLYQLANELIPDHRGYQAMYTANQMVNSIIAGDDSGAIALAEQYFAKGNGARCHTLAAIGNCHLDTAWLWPYSETKRKVARSFSSQLKIMENYPEHIFVASQAQQWAWCKEYYPELYERVKAQVAAGKFLPVGSTWIEMDGNIPSGESFVRQFFYGQKFYREELGMTCKEFWLPDTFGYSAQIPGLMKHVGLERFLTQKMSWSLVNKFPHHNFVWEGIDGSTVLAHFPPGDSYHMNLTVDEAIWTQENLQDKGRAGISAFLFGYGDGGGGPTQEMMERRRRLADTDGCPKMEMMTPDQMFERLESQQHNFCRWVGELFLELHNGTYTTQAAMKRLCRKVEFALRDAEFYLSMAIGLLGISATLPLLKQSLTDLEISWKKVLLNQFHDVIPGSSIEIVYPQAEELYNEALLVAATVRDEAIKAIFGDIGTKSQVVINSLQWPRDEVIKVTAGAVKPGSNTQKTEGGAEEYVLVSAPPMGYALVLAGTPPFPVTVNEVNEVFVLDNGFVQAEITSTGQLISLKVSGDDRDVFRHGDGTQLAGNQITIFDDEPLYWDAWDVMDYHLETPEVINAKDSKYTITPVTVVESGPLLVKLRWGVEFGKSSFTQDIELAAAAAYLTFSTSVSWHEDHKILKTVFDTNIQTNKANFDIQFGHLQRPTHMNTSWDTARYEVCGHKWADISEPDWGFAVLNESKYGWMARGHQVSLSLLRSPKAPDYTADMKDHFFKYAVMPHRGTLQEAQVVQRAYEFNNPLLKCDLPLEGVTEDSWVSVEDDGAVLHTVKPADDGSGDIIIRMFESCGCKSKVKVKLSMAIASVKASNGMEESGVEVPFFEEAGVTFVPLSFTPFSIKALRLTPGSVARGHD
ncbi:alpha-mannosidase 2C1-like [Palaemon carinicauda]|uniref:alpha-mannosidase 2C1-like n=1 Tax=Palaemon carinicauda TaxID=392227 RepID=UPI0035B5CC8F